MKLIPQWKKLWKFWSVQLITISIFLQAAVEAVTQAWIILPPNLADKVPFADKLSIVVLLLAILTRIIPQKGLTDGEGK